MLCKGLIFTEEKEVFLNHMYQGVGIWRSINSMLKLWKQRITAQKKNNKLKIIRNWAGKEIFCSAAEETPRLFLLPFPVRCWLRVAPAGMCSGLSALWLHRAVCEITQALWRYFCANRRAAVKELQLLWSQALSYFDQRTLDIKNPTDLSEQTLKTSNFSQITLEKHIAVFKSKTPSQAENWPVLNVEHLAGCCRWCYLFVLYLQHLCSSFSQCSLRKSGFSEWCTVPWAECQHTREEESGDTKCDLLMSNPGGRAVLAAQSAEPGAGRAELLPPSDLSRTNWSSQESEQ